MGQVLFSFHDVSALNFDKHEHFLRVFKEAVGSPISLMAIPHTCSHQESNLEFGEWLNQRSSEGDELFCHGLTHQSDLELDRSFFGKWANRINKNEAEFAGLSETNSQNLLDLALEKWSELGVKAPMGFCAPTWFANSHLKSQVHSKKMVYEGRFCSSDLTQKMWSFPLSLVSDSQKNWQRSLDLSFQLAKSPLPFLRFVVHPVDVASPVQWSEILKLAIELTRLRSVTSYRKVFNHVEFT